MNIFARIAQFLRGPMPAPKPPTPAPPPVAPVAAMPRLVVDTSMLKATTKPAAKAEPDWRYESNPSFAGLRGFVSSSAPTVEPSAEAQFEDEVDNLLLAEGLISSECVALDRHGRATPRAPQQLTGVPFPTEKQGEVTPEAYRNRIQYREFCKSLARDEQQTINHPWRK